MPIPEFRPEYLAFLIPVIVSVFLDKGPPFVRKWWQGIVSKELKPTVLFIGSLIAVLIVRGTACLNINIGLGATCDNPSDPQLWVNTIGLGIAVWLLMEFTNKLTSPNTAVSLNVEDMDAPININPAPAPASVAPDATPIGPGVTVEAAPNIDTIPLDRLETVELRRLLDRVVTIITDREVPPPHLGYQSEVGAGDGPKGIDPSPVG